MRNESPPRFIIPPEEEPVVFCCECGRPLYEGDYAYRIDNQVLCKECIYELMKEMCFYVEKEAFDGN